MKSKIEKIESVYDLYDGDRNIDANKLKDILNGIIDHLNSQSQPEEEEKEMTKEDIEYLEKKREKEIQEGIAWVKQREKEKMIPIKDEDINVGKLKELASDNYGKDTPEEKEDYRRDGALAFYIELEDWLYENDYVCDGDISVPTEIFMDFVAKELKLNNKKK